MTTEPLETVTLHFSYEPSVLRRAGIDPTTSEGKAKLASVMIMALDYLYDKATTLDDEGSAVAKALLAEGP